MGGDRTRSGTMGEENMRKSSLMWWEDRRSEVVVVAVVDEEVKGCKAASNH